MSHMNVVRNQEPLPMLDEVERPHGKKFLFPSQNPIKIKTQSLP